MGSKFQNLSKMVDKADDLVYVNTISARFNEFVHNDHGSTSFYTTYGKKAFMRVLEYGERRGAIMNSLADNRRWRHETPNFEIQEIYEIFNGSLKYRFKKAEEYVHGREELLFHGTIGNAREIIENGFDLDFANPKTDMGNGNKLRFNEVAVYDPDQVYPLYAIEYRL